MAGIREFLLKPFSQGDVDSLLTTLSQGECFLTQVKNVKILKFPNEGDQNLARFTTSLRTDVVKEINDMADEGLNQLVIKLSPALASDLVMVKNFTYLLEYVKKLAFEVRLVAESEKAEEAMKQFAETSDMEVYSSVDEAIAALA